MFCSKCGNKSPAGARFCHKCGAKMMNNDVPASDFPAQQPVAPQFQEQRYVDNIQHFIPSQFPQNNEMQNHNYHGFAESHIVPHDPRVHAPWPQNPNISGTPVPNISQQPSQIPDSISYANYHMPPHAAPANQGLQPHTNFTEYPAAPPELAQPPNEEEPLPSPSKTQTEQAKDYSEYMDYVFFPNQPKPADADSDNKPADNSMDSIEYPIQPPAPKPKKQAPPESPAFSGYSYQPSTYNQAPVEGHAAFSTNLQHTAPVSPAIPEPKVTNSAMYPPYNPIQAVSPYTEATNYTSNQYNPQQRPAASNIVAMPQFPEHSTVYTPQPIMTNEHTTGYQSQHKAPQAPDIKVYSGIQQPVEEKPPAVKNQDFSDFPQLPPEPIYKDTSFIYNPPETDLQPITHTENTPSFSETHNFSNFRSRPATEKNTPRDSGLKELPPLAIDEEPFQQEVTQVTQLEEPEILFNSESNFNDYSKQSTTEPDLFFMNNTDYTDYFSDNDTDEPAMSQNMDYTDYQPMDSNYANDIQDFGDYSRSHSNEHDTMVTHMPGKGNKKIVIAGIAGIAIIIIAAIIIVFSRGNVQPDHMVGTWTPPGPPIGTWVRRLEFNADGTGRRYYFDEYHNNSMDETLFTWSIEGRNNLITTLWLETATVQVTSRSGQTILRYRFDGNDDWVELRQVRI